MKGNLFLLGILAFFMLFGCAGIGKEPANVTAKAVAGGIQVSWNPVQDVAGYNIYRSAEPGVAGMKVNPSPLTGTTTYKDSDVSDKTKYYYTVKSVDAGANEYGMAQANATAHTQPPQSLQMLINKGADYTSDAQVTLALYALGATDCRYSNDGNTWSDWTSYIVTKSWALPSGDGDKEVFYQCRDELGNTAEPVSAAIFLNTVPPAITLTSPVGGQTYSDSVDIIFTVADVGTNTVTCTGKVDNKAISVGVVSVGVSNKINVPVESGSHTLVLECSDSVLKSSKTVGFSSFDKPSVSIVVGNGAGYTDSMHVYVAITATMAKECRLSNDGVKWQTWFPVTRLADWQLTYGDGTKYVYAECRNAEGTMSDTASDSIILDTSPPPYISVSINNAESWTNSRQVVLGLYAYAAFECRYSNDETTWSVWERYGTARSWVLSPGTGTKHVYYNCRKVDGSDVGTASAKITYSESPPDPPSQLSIRINSGASYTQTRSVYLTLYARNAYACRFQEGGSGWTDWEDYRTNRDFTLSSGDGQKIVYYQCKNGYGTSSSHASIYLDASPPHRITDLASSVSGNSVYLRWSSVGDEGSGIAGYDVYKSNTGMGLFVLVGTTKSTSYTDYSVKPGNTYAYYVRAKDFAGRESEDSNVVTAEMKGKGYVTVSISAPQEGAQVYPPVVLTFQPDDPAYAEVRCDYYLNGRSFPAGNVATGKPYSVTLNLDPHEIKYTASVICTDDSGSSGNSGNRIFYPVPDNSALTGPATTQ